MDQAKYNVDELSDDMLDDTDQEMQQAAPAEQQQSDVPEEPLVVLDGLAFVEDEATYRAMAAVLGPDAQTRVAQGGVETAITHLQQAACPRMLVVDISSATDPMAHVDALADVCEPGTVVIALGQVNDINLFRQLTDAGVMDYLVKPLAPETFQKSIEKAHAQLSNAFRDGTGGLVTVFVGARSGTGTSTIAMNAATVLSQEMGQKTAIVDLDLLFGTVALLLDVEAGTGLRELLENPSRMDSMVLSSASSMVNEHLFVLAAEESLSSGVVLDPEFVSEFLSELRQHFDHVIVDMPPTVAVENWKAISESSQVVLVSDLSLFGLRDTMRMLTAARTVMEDERVLVTVNKTGGEKAAEVDRKNFEKTIDHKIDIEIPDDRKAAVEAVRAGKPIVETAPKSRITQIIREELCPGLSPDASEDGGDEADPSGKGKAGWFRRKK